jgi:transposase-like protein
VPLDRRDRFSTEIFARYQRSEKALVAALIEMYVHGVSTRKIKAISDQGGSSMSGRQGVRRAWIVKARCAMPDRPPK